MSPLLTFAVVTAVWLLIQGLVGGRLLGVKGRPYKPWIVVIHIILFLPIVGGWAITVTQLSATSANHVGSWIAEILMGLGIVALVVGGVILTAGRKVPAPQGLVRTHQVGMAAASLGALAGIVCILVGA